MPRSKTVQTFVKRQFHDIFGVECSIQESTVARERAIWLGVNRRRMHLNRVLAKEIIRDLKFIFKLR